MAICCTDRLIHEMRRLIGRILALGRLHVIRRASIDGVQVIMKSRRLISRTAIPVGNLYHFLQRSNIEILSEKEWLRWEFAVDAAGHHGRILRTDSTPLHQFRGLVCRFSQGRTLKEILVDDRCSHDQKFLAMGWAINALFELQHCQADWGRGIRQEISHGDATCHNVIICFESQSACWIDFDTRHVPRLPAVERHSDDLRALLFSSAAHLPPSSYPKLAAQFIASKPNQAIIAHFSQRLSGDRRRPNTFQLAQAPLSWTNSIALLDALQTSLPGERRD